MKELYSAGKCEFHVIGGHLDNMGYLILDIGLSHFNNANSVVGNLELSPLPHYYNKHLRFLTSVKISESVIDEESEIEVFFENYKLKLLNNNSSIDKLYSTVMVEVMLYRSTYITLGDELIYTANIKVRSKENGKIVFNTYFSQL